MKKPALHWQILIALILGVVYGLWFPSGVVYISWMGDVFLRLLKMIIIPLVFSSIVTGVAGIGSPSSLGRLGLKTVFYYFSTSLFAILAGLILVNLIKPGVGADLRFAAEVDSMPAAAQSLSELLVGMIPENLFEVLSKADMLPIIFFAIVFGFFTNLTANKHQLTIRNFFEATFEVMMRITMAIIKLTPLGVFAIIAVVVSRFAGDAGAMADVFARMGLYMLTVMAGLLFHSVITMSIILRFAGRINPLSHFKNMSVPLLTAFSTSSSSATLPLTMEAIEKNNGVSNKISSFTLPLGATINMDGTALYECVAVMFIAQAYGIDLSFTQQMVVVLTALLAAIGAAGIPMAGLVMMAVVLKAVGLPLEGIGLVLAVDRILDMFRTAVNVYGDTCGATIIASSEGEKLKV
ncbi:Proton/glutamate-aspartate symporter [anaerobic digester metagenome]